MLIKSFGLLRRSITDSTARASISQLRIAEIDRL